LEALVKESGMDERAWIGLVVVALVLIAAAVWAYVQKRRSAALHDRFGPEYARAVREHGDERRAEAELEQREQRVQRLPIRSLAPSDREGFAQAWRSTQAHFVDDPKAATANADQLVSEVMHARGYPVGDFDQRAADVSVDHPRVVENYRAAHQIALCNERGEAGTEELRTALVHYRALFEELLETEPAEHTEVRR